MTSNVVDGLQSLCIPIHNLELLPNNPKHGDVDAIARSLKTLGQHKPIVARRIENSKGIVLAGNHTLQAALQLGWDEIAVVFVDDDEQTGNARSLADNRTSDLGTYDNEALLNMIDSIEDAELMQVVGYSKSDLDDLLNMPAPITLSEDQKLAILINCDSEAQQEELFDRLVGEGYDVKVLTL